MILDILRKLIGAQYLNTIVKAFFVLYLEHSV